MPPEKGSTVAEEELDSDDDVRVRTPRRKRRIMVELSDEEDEEVCPAAPRKKRLRPPLRVEQEEAIWRVQEHSVQLRHLFDCRSRSVGGDDSDGIEEDDDVESMTSFIVADSDAEAEEDESRMSLAMDVLGEEKAELERRIEKGRRRLERQKKRLVEVEREMQDLGSCFLVAEVLDETFCDRSVIR
jgi:hypothetical protein